MDKGIEMVNCPYCDREFKSEQGLVKHVTSSHKIAQEALYLKLKLQGEIPVCACGCNQRVEFVNWSKGYKKYYSTDHYHSHKKSLSRENRVCPVCKEEFTILKSAEKTHCSPKCAANSEHIQNKRRQGNIKKYGVPNPMQSEEVKEKTKQTVKRKYGVESVLQLPKVQKAAEIYREKNQDQMNIRRAKTVSELYGVENISQLEEVKGKVRATNRAKFGVDYPMQNSEVQDNFFEYMEEAYGTRSVQEIPEFKEKAIKTTLWSMYERIKSADRIPDSIVPLFTKESYFGTKGIKYKWKCKDCDSIFFSTIHNGRIPICWTCNPQTSNTSKAETEIFEYLQTLDVPVIKNDRTVLDNKELDIYLPEHNIAIEYNGLYFHSEEFRPDRNYHLDKTKQCEKQDIRLIHIFEDEWTHKQEIVKARLKYLLNKSSERIYARKCQIKEISHAKKKAFLEQYHLQGDTSSSINLGLFYKDNLISAMTFSKARAITSTEAEYELIRFASSCVITGGASKLFSHFLKTYDPESVISYADRRWSYRGAVYEKLGFNQVASSKPNYWYAKQGKRFHRATFMKSKLERKLDTFDPSLTEVENMKMNGYDRLWDCGNFKYIWRKKEED
jgi:hypothetical protein